MLNFKENVALSQYTVFKIGGLADFFCEVHTKEELIEALNWAGGKKVPYFILGAGSNLLVSDEGFRGLVIKMNLQELKVVPTLAGQGRSGENRIFASAGVSMARAVNFTIENKFGGFEWGIGVPGSIGGSVFGNAGCYGGEMKDVVESVEVLDSSSAHDFPDTRIFLLKNLSARASRAAQGLENHAPSEASSNPDCNFAYRHSIFKKHPEWIILGAVLSLHSSNPNESRAKVLEYSKRRTKAQDIGSKCAGCIFKNPALPAGRFTPAGTSEPTVSASFLIDKAGLKGRAVGRAAVSDKHANFILNTGGATARDVRELISVVQEEVRKIHGVELETEIRFLGL